jgi:hypothetical protein
LVDAAESAAGFARRWRNKHLAHRDRTVALERGPKALPEVSRQDVEDVLQRFRDVMNRAHSAYLGGEVMFKYFLASGDADDVVFALAMAADVEQKRQERARHGRSLPDDFEFPRVP